jgi:hypothetical protein
VHRKAMQRGGGTRVAIAGVVGVPCSAAASVVVGDVTSQSKILLNSQQ